MHLTDSYNIPVSQFLSNFPNLADIDTFTNVLFLMEFSCLSLCVMHNIIKLKRTSIGVTNKRNYLTGQSQKAE